jgi:putative ABC transport system permease protein
VVLGAELAERLFGRRAAVGERVDVNGVGHEVIGVLARKGDQISSLGPPDDEDLFLPLTTMQTLITGDERISFVAVAPRADAPHQAIVREVRRVLGASHGFAATDPDALTVFDAMNFVDLFRDLTAALRLFVAALGVASLAAGGMGVANMLLLSVTERRREIGLRRALGARRLEIAGQFVLEGVVLTGVGGIAGAVLGWVLCALAGAPGGAVVVAHFSPPVVELAVGLVGLVGVLAGLGPALRAATLDPAGELRA